MLEKKALCLALSVSLSGIVGIGRAERIHAHSAAPADPCCGATERRLKRLPLPADASQPAVLRDIYRFVGSHLDLMRQLPCFCGCHDDLGHRSAADCYVEHMSDAARAGWSTHAAGCGMCIGIAREAMTMHAKNISVDDIRQHIQTKYGPK